MNASRCTCLQVGTASVTCIKISQEFVKCIPNLKCRTNDFDKPDEKTSFLHKIEKYLLFPDENFAKSYEKLTTGRFSSAFHTILQNFRQEKVEIFLFYAKAGFSFGLSKPQNLPGSRNRMAF
jgi:hypothetical protein